MIHKRYCEVCSQEREFQIKEGNHLVSSKGGILKSMESRHIVLSVMLNSFTWHVQKSMYRQAHRLLQPNEIKLIRDKHELS